MAAFVLINEYKVPSDYVVLMLFIARKAKITSNLEWREYISS
jgi:hypothetical protein